MTDRHVTFAWLRAEDAGRWRGATRTWTSEVHPVPFGATSVVASWHATTPPGSWIEVSVRGRNGRDAIWGPWLTLAVWASSDETVAPTTVSGQDLDGIRVKADEVRLEPASAWCDVQARVVLRHRDDAPRPELHRLGLVTSRVPAEPGEPSAPVLGHAVVIDVPAYSQAVHRDTYPDYGGGQAWCSPTSVTMVLDHFGRLPSPEVYAWVGKGPDRVVPHGARRTFDLSYGGTGNWSFNVAYANDQGLEAFVTRLRSMAEAERFVAAGIPLVLSVTFRAEELTGAGYSTRGHLLTLIGFTTDGDPVVNDPASHEVPDNAEVRTTYDRAELEGAWLRGSGGIVYVMRPPDVPLPEAPAEANW